MSTERTIDAKTSGPVTVDLTGRGMVGAIIVRAERNCKRAKITVSTEDNSGPAAEAVQHAELSASGDHLRARVEGAGGGGVSSTVITDGGRTVIQSTGRGSIAAGGNVSGAIISSGGDIHISGRGIVVSGNTVVTSGGIVTSGITILAVVPEGSKAVARAEDGMIRMSGAIAEINAENHNGDIDLERTDMVTAETRNGNIRIGDFGGTATLNNRNGNIEVHATSGGNIDAETRNGNVRVTATQAAIDDDLDVRANSRNGRVQIPPRPRDNGPRRRRS